MKNILPVVSLLLFASTACPANANEHAEREAVRDRVKAVAREYNWAELERLYRHYTEVERRTGSGFPKVLLFGDGLLARPEPSNGKAEFYLAERDRLTAQWAKANPKSAVAVVFHAKSRLDHAYFFRGSGYANSVPPHAWADFQKAASASAQFLLEHKAVGAHDPGWYATAISAGTALGWERERILSIAKEGMDAFPDDERIPRSVIWYLLPKWFGDIQLVDQFINQVAERTKKERGMEMYARLYSGVARAQFQHQLFTQSKAEWPKMKRGLEDMVRNFPGEWNTNMFAYYSCVAQDKEKTRELLKKIGDAPLIDRWEPNGQRMFDGCRRWANQP